MNNRVYWGGLIASWVLWPALFIVSVACVSTLDSPSPSKDPLTLGDLKVFNSTQTAYGTLERKEAIMFSLTQVNTHVQYLMMAAAALVVFLVKLFPEKAIDALPADKLAFATMSNGVIGFSVSLAYGVFSMSYFVQMGTKPTFSLYDETSSYALLQMTTFAGAIGLTGILVIRIAYRMFWKGDPQ